MTRIFMRKFELRDWLTSKNIAWKRRMTQTKGWTWSWVRLSEITRGDYILTGSLSSEQYKSVDDD